MTSSIYLDLPPKWKLNPIRSGLRCAEIHDKLEILAVLHAFDIHIIENRRYIINACVVEYNCKDTEMTYKTVFRFLSRITLYFGHVDCNTLVMREQFQLVSNIHPKK